MSDINPNLYYFCRIGKNPNMAKIRACCARKECPHIGMRPRKNHSQKDWPRGKEEPCLSVERLFATTAAV
jgi:hypothetical protein